jgi:probable F420-dependent oxidoreductase
MGSLGLRARPAVLQGEALLGQAQQFALVAVIAILLFVPRRVQDRAMTADMREDAVKFGLSTLTRGVFTTPESYSAVAKAAERAGFDFLSVSDHLVVPASFDSRYPYHAAGVFAAAEHGHCFDQLSTVAFLAGCTEHVRLLTSVTVVPHRPAMLTAKMLATIDVLSKGRLIIGAGAGWMREEFELLGVRFEDRGRLTDEYLAAFKELWTNDKPAYDGKYVKFSDLLFYPKPVQKPHPPLWIGGESPSALRRTIKFADAWYPGSDSQTKPLDTAERLSAGIADVKRACAAAGRDPATLGVALLVQGFFEWGDYNTPDGTARRLFTGSSADMAADAANLSSLGVGHVSLRLGGNTAQECVARIDRFGAEVIDKMRR